VRDLLRRTALDDADARVAVELARDPDRADAWYCRGIIANRRRDHANAIAALRRAIALRPDAALAWLALGTAFSRGSEWSEATDAYGRAIEHEPSWADAHLNLGLARKQLGDNEGALRAFHAAWVRDPMLTEAARQCVAAIADDVTHDPDTADFAERDEPAPLHPSFTVVVCSIDAAKQTRAVALYRRLFADFPHEIVAVTNPRSLAEAYNQAAQASRADIVLMSHDDVDVIAPDFASRIARLLATRVDALGVIGATRLDGPAVGWSGHPNLRGWIVHRDGDETGWRLDVLDHRPFADGVEILDGVVMAARRDVLRAVPFRCRDLRWLPPLRPRLEPPRRARRLSRGRLRRIDRRARVARKLRRRVGAPCGTLLRAARRRPSRTETVELCRRDTELAAPGARVLRAAFVSRGRRRGPIGAGTEAP